MSSEAEQLAAKLAEIADTRKKKDKRQQLMELEAEQERLEEECLQGELERMRVEEQRKQEAAKVAVAAEEAAKMEFAKKQAEELAKEDSVEVTVGDVVEEHGVVWYAKEGWVCEECEKCLWTDAPWATACQDGSEAGPSKRKKVGSMKGKGKEKEGSELGMGTDAIAALLAEIDVGYIADYMQRTEDEQRGEGVDMEGVEVEGMGGNVGVGDNIGVWDNVGGEGSEQEVDGTLQ
ncbi:hypothetical protein PILCRDRAFT_15656 [Piloderma croceum F 1598]|uniref:Uncharacterized protein n=1 Tax=Piloderma croceum (strain F 1598) TaxID=765440 RepID=A0A0C3B6K9_PILCF|nr:hypothetical protein PILCRDRAFT_15656 [Piloderma croceum F 1598]